MKTLASSLTVFVLLFLSPACMQEKPAPEPVIGNPIHLSARVAGQTTDFAFDLAQRLDARQPKEKNIFVSPLSLHIALGMLVNGAEGETREGLLKTLKADAASIEELNNAYTTLLEELPLADNKVKLAIANSVWYQEAFAVKQSFKDVVSEVFNASLNAEPFNNSTVHKINQWASDNTQGKIKKVLDDLSGDMVMVLMNALYFKGDWKYTFDPRETKDWDFQLASGDKKTVKMMFNESDFRTFYETDFSVIELPYASGQYNLTLFVPNPGKTVRDIIRQLDNEKWQAITAGFQKRGIKVGLPKFSLDYEILLNETLKEMGMSSAFDPRLADFRGISEADLYVSFVKQNTFLGIDETGTEAAAVTTIGMELTSAGPGARPAIIADRPFFFTISENTSNTILFTGRIVNP